MDIKQLDTIGKRIAFILDIKNENFKLKKIKSHEK